MSFDSRRQYLTPSDMTMIEHVLAEAGFRKKSGSTEASDAARFLAHKFQDGMIEQRDLSKALRTHLAQ